MPKKAEESTAAHPAPKPKPPPPPQTKLKHRFENVVLGFCEPATWETNSPAQFASKAGGRPTWLARTPCTPPPCPKCTSCRQGMTFLCQVYAPLETEAVGHDEAFHRVLYVAVCREAGCHRGGRQCVAVLRAQLRRTNSFYRFDGGGAGGGSVGSGSGSENEDEEDEDEDEDDVGEVRDVCVLCGFWGELVCGSCHTTRYCSRRCQRVDWGLGHKDSCPGTGDGVTDVSVDDAERARKRTENARRRWRLPEMEIVTDRHGTPPQSDDSDSDESDSDSDSGYESQAATNMTAETQDDENTSDDDGNHHPNTRPSTTRIRTSSSSRRRPPDDTTTATSELPKGTFQDADSDELPDDLFAAREGRTRPDGVQKRFRKVIAYEPEQVVRYERGGKPLWGLRTRRCNGRDIGVCGHCGGARVFEMQVMAPLLYMLETCRRRGDGEGGKGGRLSIKEVAERLRDGMDWVTVVVMTCEASCPSGGEGAFVEEFAWIQHDE